MRSSAALALTLLLADTAIAQRVIEVRPGHGAIAAAIRSARAGDRLVVTRGVYLEPTIVVDRPLTIAGEPGAVIDGGAATHTLLIEADEVTVRGLTFRGGTASHVEDRAAIRVGDVRGCRIEDNRVIGASFGIYLAASRGCVVARNEVRGAGAGRSEDAIGNAIHLWTARDAEILDNRISGHRDGIYLEFSHGTRVRGNTSEGNVRYGLHFMSSEDCHYERNVFRRNEAGVAVMYTKRVAIVDNRFEDNLGSSSYGLLLKEVYDAELTANAFVRNTVALFADGATRLRAEGNLFDGNGWAVKLMSSTESASFTGNVFTRNTFDVSTNSVSATSRIAGNFWDEYRGYDLDRDGRGDVPHHPVRLFSLIVERTEPTLALLRSPLVAVLDRAERALPSLTPATLADPAPLMRRPR